MQTTQVHDPRDMWADESQRQRIFEMIGANTVRSHRVRNARLEHHRRLAIGLLLAAASIWVFVAFAG